MYNNCKQLNKGGEKEEEDGVEAMDRRIREKVGIREAVESFVTSLIPPFSPLLLLLLLLSMLESN